MLYADPVKFMIEVPSQKEDLADPRCGTAVLLEAESLPARPGAPKHSTCRMRYALPRRFLFGGAWPLVAPQSIGTRAFARAAFQGVSRSSDLLLPRRTPCCPCSNPPNTPETFVPRWCKSYKGASTYDVNLRTYQRLFRNLPPFELRSLLHEAGHASSFCSRP